VVLFGPTDAAFFGYADNSNIDASACVPCWWSTPDWMGRCPRGLAQPACMAAITPERVLEAVQDTLERRLNQPAPPLNVLGIASWSPEETPGSAMLDAIENFAELTESPDGHARSPSTGCHLHATKHWEYAMALNALAIAHASPCQPLRIADLGCGRGPLGPWLASQGHTVVGYDHDFAWDGNNEAAQRFLGWTCDTRFTPRAATLYALPEPDGQPDQGFDAVLLISVLQHLERPALVLREALRILKPGGRLIVSFDLANEPERHEDRKLRRAIASPCRLAEWLGVDEADIGLPAADICQSAADLQASGVAGMPEGLTVGLLWGVRGDCD